MDVNPAATNAGIFFTLPAAAAVIAYDRLSRPDLHVREVRQDPPCTAHSAARFNNNVRSRAFCASEAARSNSARASSLRASLKSKSPRTLGSK
jgi:hypothetical protein